MYLERFRVVELAEVRPVPVRRDHQMPGRVRELVQQHERALAAMHDELLLVVARRGAAEDAAVLLVRALDVLEAPRRPEALHYSQRFQRKKPSMLTITPTNAPRIPQNATVLP